MHTKESIKASSATYRKATNMMAKQLRIDPEHTEYPSDDFKEMADLIPEKVREKALQWYKMGIKRGLAKATDMMLEGKISKRKNTVFCPSNFEVKVITKFAGEKWKSRKYTIRAKDIGFK